MRIAAWTLTIVAALICLSYVAVAEMWFVPVRGTYVTNPFLAVAAARGSLPLAGLALLNGVAVLIFLRRRRPGALSIVLGAGLLALAVALWMYFAALPDAELPPVHFFDASGINAVEQGRAWLRGLLAWAALGFTIVGWSAWLVNRRITLNLDRG